MIDGVEELRQLEVDLANAGDKAQEQGYGALRHEAREMRDDWRAAVGSGPFRGASAALSYDVMPTGLREITAEVGFEKEGQGNLGNILEHGTSTQGPVRPAGEQVVTAGADRLERFLATLDPLP